MRPCSSPNWIFRFEVGNISAGSWGQPNLLAYVKEYGTFGADAAILVLNGGDMWDRPTYLPPNPRIQPSSTPVSATSELLLRYVIPRTGEFLGIIELERPTYVRPEDRSKGPPKFTGEDLKQLLLEFRHDGIPVIVFYQPEARELVTNSESGYVHPGFAPLRKICRELDVPFRSLHTSYARATEGGGSPYRDSIHLNQQGHSLLADEILGAFRDMGLMSRWSSRVR